MKNKTLIALILLALFSFKEEDNAKVVLIRKGLYAGVGGDVNLFVDGKIICELKNNSFNTQSISEGKHTFSARWTSKEAKESDEHSLELDVQKGQEYYLRVVKQNKGLTAYLYLEEVTANSWKNLKTDLKEDDCH